jgi:SAM-dependent methyltransferase
MKSGCERIPAGLTDDYRAVTEIPGGRATREQLARLYHRYHTASRYAGGRRVLEVACGAGLGLGYLSRDASLAVGGDYTENLLHLARSHYRQRVPLLRLDAHHLPFRSGSFDLVVILEAIYYLQNAAGFLAEVRRVLADGGLLLISTVNKDWTEFGPSPFSTRYYSVPELGDLLGLANFTDLEFYGAFPAQVASFPQKLVSLIRRLVVALDLLPQSLEGRARFKRIFYGKLSPLPREVQEGLAALYPLERLPAGARTFDRKIIYCVARRNNPGEPSCPETGP